MYQLKLPFCLKLTEMTQNDQNDPIFDLRWKEGLPRTDLHTGTRYSASSGRNGTESPTLVLTGNHSDNAAKLPHQPISKNCKVLIDSISHWGRATSFGKILIAND